MAENPELSVANPGVLLTTSEVADLLRMTGQRIRRMRADGTGPAFIKLPTGTVRYRIEDVQSWIGSPS